MELSRSSHLYVKSGLLSRAADQKVGIETFIVRNGLSFSQRTLRYVACITSLLIAGVLVFVSFELPIKWRIVTLAIGGMAAIFTNIYVILVRRRSNNDSALIRELPSYYLGITYSVFRVIPLVLFARLTLIDPRMWLIFIINLIFFLLQSFQSIKYRYE